MEKAFALSSAIPDLMSNGKVAIYYKTLDARVSHLVIKDGFDWKSRKKQEVFRCPKCRAFIFPDEKVKTRDGQKYHSTCVGFNKS